jgi:hypothetical protein
MTPVLGVSEMEKLAITMLFMAAMSFLTFAASFAEPPPRSEIAELSLD